MVEFYSAGTPVIYKQDEDDARIRGRICCAVVFAGAASIVWAGYSYIENINTTSQAGLNALSAAVHEPQKPIIKEPCPSPTFFSFTPKVGRSNHCP